MRRALAITGTFVWMLVACGTAQPGGMSGPTMGSSLSDEPPPTIQSDDILGREARTNRARVKHVLIGWRDLGTPGQDERAQKRTRVQADTLAEQLLERARSGEPFEVLMKEHSEDPGSAASGTDYEVTPDASLVFEFKRLSLRLDVDEVGLVMSQFGWHVIKRVQ